METTIKLESKITKARWTEVLEIYRHWSKGGSRGTLTLDEFQHIRLWLAAKRNGADYTPPEESAV